MRDPVILLISLSDMFRLLFVGLSNLLFQNQITIVLESLVARTLYLWQKCLFSFSRKVDSGLPILSEDEKFEIQE